jgi:hypothetical protein
MLQQGARPRKPNGGTDPDEAIGKVHIHRCVIGDNPGAVPSEAFQYDLVYNAFKDDKAFWKYWNVVGCARSSASESISSKNAYIRVVMDLTKEVKLYPTAYTPGFPTVPRNLPDAEIASVGKKIPGLPEGYSVALDVYILEDAKILLEHQHAFRGRVDPKYRWLHEIVNPGAPKEEIETNELAKLEVTPMDSNFQQATKHWTWTTQGKIPPSECGYQAQSQSNARSSSSSQIMPAVSQRLREGHYMLTSHEPAAIEPLPLSCFTACNRGLAKDPTLSTEQLRLQEKRREIHMENALINAFGDHVGLPKRDMGSWGHTDDEGALRARRKAFEEESAKLDRDLDILWKNTVDGSNPLST